MLNNAEKLQKKGAHLHSAMIVFGALQTDKEHSCAARMSYDRTQQEISPNIGRKR